MTGMPPPDPTLRALVQWVVALALVVLPLGAGMGLRVLFSRPRGAARPLAAALLVGLVAAGAAWVDPCSLPVDLDDAAWLLLLTLAGALVARRGAWPSWALGWRLLVATAFVLGGLELGCRLLLPPDPLPSAAAHLPGDFLRGPRPERSYGLAYVGVVNETQARACGLAYPGLWPEAYRQRLEAASGQRVRLLHVGDSMVEALQVGGPTGARPFVGRLAGLLPGTGHVNGGVSGTGIDLQGLLLGEWTGLERYDGIVLYVFLLNDLFYTGTRYPCCGGRTVAGALAGGDASACGPDRAPGCWRQWLQAGRGPYVLRVTTPYSRLVRALRLRLEVRQLNALTEPLPERRQWHDLERALVAVRDTAARRGVPLAVVLLPERSALDPSAGACPGCPPLGPSWLDKRAELLALAGRLGLTVWDPWEHLSRRARLEEPSAWFVPAPPFPPGDVHFGDRGHELMAEWLAEQLRAWPPVAAALREAAPRP